MHFCSTPRISWVAHIKRQLSFPAATHGGELELGQVHQQLRAVGALNLVLLDGRALGRRLLQRLQKKEEGGAQQLCWKREGCVALVLNGRRLDLAPFQHTIASCNPSNRF